MGPARVRRHPRRPGVRGGDTGPARRIGAAIAAHAAFPGALAPRRRQRTRTARVGGQGHAGELRDRGHFVFAVIAPLVPETVHPVPHLQHPGPDRHGISGDRLAPIAERLACRGHSPRRAREPRARQAKAPEQIPGGRVKPADVLPGVLVAVLVAQVIPVPRVRRATTGEQERVHRGAPVPRMAIPRAPPAGDSRNRHPGADLQPCQGRPPQGHGAKPPGDATCRWLAGRWC